MDIFLGLRNVVSSEVFEGNKLNELSLEGKIGAVVKGGYKSNYYLKR